MENTKNPAHMIRGVQALYPRVNSPYRFDTAAGAKGKSVPCGPMDEGAKYELQVRMSKAQAKELYAAMSAAYAARKEKSWPAKLGMPFGEDEDGTYTGKTVLKAAYGAETTEKPLQVDAKNNSLPADFQLTTGSVVNIQVSLVPYNMRDNGVSLRLRSVQVISYKPQETYSPFDVEEGFTFEDAPVVTGFEETAVPAPAPADLDDVFDAEPTVKTAKANTPTPKEESLDDLVEGWDD
jgi:hypothetical protein